MKKQKTGSRAKGGNPEPKKAAHGKKALLGDIVRKTVGKITETVKKRRPFGGGRKKKQQLPPEPPQEFQELQKPQIDELDQNTYEAGGDQGNGLFGNFFYTDEGVINRFEDAEILKKIQKKYPQFNPGQQGETAMRNAVIKLLSDSKFIEELLEWYSMTIFDFFKFLFRIDSSIYKGGFVQKVQKVVQRRKYAAVKRYRYDFQKQARRSRRGKKRL